VAEPLRPTEPGLGLAGGFQDRQRARLGLRLSCHAHVLRHSFAVITLEQLWRGHIQELAAMTPMQRETYQMIFGDPLNCWSASTPKRSAS
jgi:hypothetical protein